MVNRKTQPEIKDIKNFGFKKAEKISFNNIPVYTVNAGEQDIIKTDFIFDAGKIFDKNILLPVAVNSLADKGTEKYGSQEIAEKLDFYGAYYETEITKHNSVFTLYTLSKYFEQTFDIFFEFLFNATFPENEINIFLENKYRNFIIGRQKTNVRSWEKFQEVLFGENHPYGKIIKENDFKNINREKIINFYDKFYCADDLKILISGKIKDEHLKTIEKYLKNINRKQKKQRKNIDFEIKHRETKKHFVKIENTVQYSLKIGKVSLNKHHPDYFNLRFCTILLGGYFGSRLMSNIREDKGYTYGIYAGNQSFLNAGYFYISAETGKNVYQKAVKEVYKELKLLRTQTVSDDEINMVKKWIYGNVLKMFDGVFAVSDMHKALILSRRDFDFFENYIKAVKNITPETIKQISGKYLHEESMYEVIAGA